MRILVIGSDGTIGRALAQALGNSGHEAIGTTRNPENIDEPSRIFLNLASGKQPLLPDADVAVICAAMARFEECRNQPELARRVNVTAPIDIAEQLLPRGTRVLLLSTSAVFDSFEPFRKPDSVRAPRSAYGRLKVEAENRLLEMGTGTSVLRLTKVLTSQDRLTNKWIGDLKTGNTITAFKDHRFSPLSLTTVINAIAQVIERNENGVFQISGAFDISYVDAALYIASRLGRSANSVMRVAGADHGLLDNEVAHYTSLDTSRLSQMIGFLPPRPFDVLDGVYGAAIAAA
jgi:dTDP-4-dehydrorhamnose reductase